MNFFLRTGCGHKDPGSIMLVKLTTGSCPEQHQRKIKTSGNSKKKKKKKHHHLTIDNRDYVSLLSMT